MMVTTRDGSGLALWRGLRMAAAAGVAALLVAACGGDSDCSSEPAFGGEAVGECAEDNGGGSETPTASSLTLLLTDANGAPVESLPNNGVDKITAVATATGTGGVTLEGIPVTFSVDNDALVTQDAKTTDKGGEVSGAVGIGNNRAVRIVTVTATSGSLKRSATFQVTGATLTATPLPAVIAPGAAGKVDFLLSDSNSRPMGNQSIVVSGVGGVEVSGKTDINGAYSYAYTAPASGGNLDIRATAAGVTATKTVLVQSGTGTIPPATVTTPSASLAASPSVVPVNTSATSNRAELRALFVGPGNAPVPNVRVRFDLAGDANNVGGTLTSGTNVVYSDANGVATAAYVPGTQFSPNDGLTVRACWSANDFPAGTCPNATTTTLTVVSGALSVTIFTDALIEVSAQSYIKTYTVQVVDSSGSAKAGVEISKSVDNLRYMKGEWVVSGDKWAKVQRASCDNEDLNRNGVIEVYSNGAVENANGNAQLDPRQADVAISFVGSSATDSNGQVKLRVTYGQNVASWVEFSMLVAASGVAGTEHRAAYQGVLPVLADAVSDPDVEPAFRVSPYGVEASPTVLTTNPAGQSGMLCTNPN